MSLVPEDRPVVLTLGDPSGIGPEIAVRAWAELRGSIPFVLIGDLGVVAAAASRLGVRVREVTHPAEASGLDALPVLAHPLPAQARPGVPDPANARAIVGMIERGVALVHDRQATALCTNPIHKAALKEATDFPFPGHTEFLAHLCGGVRPVMLLASPALRVVPVTIHIALAEVASALSADLLEETLCVTHRGLARDFGIAEPRLAVAGLNPHAGEAGTMGREEIDIIAPVLERLRAEGLRITGPHAADSLFHAEARSRYDVAICMYHDQALVPLKTLDFAHGVNVTLGLDIVRTSPDHGTAYDIAGTFTADHRSLVSALRLASTLAATRRSWG